MKPQILFAAALALALAGCSPAAFMAGTAGPVSVSSVAPTPQDAPARDTVAETTGVSPLSAYAPATGNIGPDPDLNALIDRYAALYGIPASLVHRVVRRESTYNAGARNGPYYGLMQILPQTARTMGYDGPASGLLDAETNLRYAVKYLRGAYLVAGGNHDRAVSLYASGYYYHARDMGLLEETGLR